MNFNEMLDKSNNIVFFGGAGVSTESGIPDFRGRDGLFNSKYKYPPEEILSHSFYLHNKADFFEFYKEKMINLNAKPNVTHYALAKLEEKGKLNAVVTQNIDGLHQKAGSKNVLELHGSVMRNYCVKCGKFFTAQEILDSEDIPLCSCGGHIKPDVVLYEESLNNDVVEGAINAIKKADMLIVGGTSLTVFPAAALIRYYSGDKLIVINKTHTPQDNFADLVIRKNLSEVFAPILEKIK